MCIAAGLFGAARLKPMYDFGFLSSIQDENNRQRRRFDTLLPWVAQAAAQSTLCISVPWEDHFGTPIKELRDLINLPPLPETLPNQ